MPSNSALQPIDPSSMPAEEKEKEVTWIVRKLVGSMTGRIVMSSYESLRATGTSVICLSPWGDSSPLLLPCIRFRDLAVHMVIAATGGTAAIAAPVMSPVGDVIVATLGDTIIVEMGLHAGFQLAVEGTNEIFIDKPIHHLMPSNDNRLFTTGIKELTITLTYKHTMMDASLGFFRSSVHGDVNLFSKVSDYLAVEKGWFSPYLFASARRPIIPRTMTPDVVFCHGPFLSGDYRIGQTLLDESATIITVCMPSTQPASEEAAPGKSKSHLHFPSFSEVIDKASSKFSQSRSPSPSRDTKPLSPPTYETVVDASSTQQPTPPRRMVLVILGIKPHRHLWTTSARPSESVIKYILLNGCPAVVLPVKPGSPLIAWDTLTLEELHKIGKSEGGVDGDKAKGVVDVIFEYLALCVDWERVPEPKVESGGEGKEDLERAIQDLKVSKDNATKNSNVVSVNEMTAQGVEPQEAGIEDATEGKKVSVKEAVRLLVMGAINSRESKEVKKEVDLDRAGIAMFRIP